MRYLLTVVSAQFFEGKTIATREFDAPSDVIAINHAEVPLVPIKFVIPGGGGTCGSFPRKLIELTEPPRLVKEW